jgi:Mn-dependent DtxR family transcriptional regulator
MVAELRNEGYVEEEVRGVVRLTPRGYQLYKKKVGNAFSATRWV